MTENDTLILANESYNTRFLHLVSEMNINKYKYHLCNACINAFNNKILDFMNLSSCNQV